MKRFQHTKTLGIAIIAITVIFLFDVLNPDHGTVFGSDSRSDSENPDVFSAEAAIEDYFKLVYSSEDPIFQDIEMLSGTVEESTESSDLQTVSQIEQDLVTIRYGDSLSSIFEKHNAPATDLLAIIKADHSSKPLRRIVVGEQIRLEQNEHGDVQSFTYIPDIRHRYVYTRTDEGFQHERVDAIEESKTIYKYVVIERGQSTITAGLQAGIRNEETILKMTNLLQWNIDFWFDIHPDDSYKILYNEIYIDGNYATDGDILAIEFKTRKKVNRLLRYEIDGEFKGYYNSDGSTIVRQFLRAPLNYVRVSSEFSPRRFHPVHKVNRPHNGVDYAAPHGTPGRATADGTVIKASYTRPNGNYVFIRHPNNYETRYLHFSKIAKGIKSGTQVKQGQLIGYVGATGYATGPHLHYEIVINGEPVNPRTVDLPEQVPLKGDAFASFKEHIRDLEARFDQAHENWSQQNRVVAEVSQ